MSECDVTPLGAYPGQHPEALFFLNLQGEFTLINEPGEQLLGYEAAQLMGQLLASLIDPEGMELVEPVLARAMQGSVLTFEVRLRTSAGKYSAYSVTTFPLLTGHVLEGIGGILRPADDVNQSDSAVREREKQLSIIFRTVADVIFVIKVESAEHYRFLYVNRAFEDITGLSSDQVVARLVNEIIPEPSLSVVLEKYREAVATRQRVTWLETSDYPTGRLVGEVTITPVIDDEGECCQLVGIVHDLTKQKAVENALRDSNDRFRYALKATTDALYDWDIAADTLLWGEGFEDLFGYHLETNPSQFGQWSDFVHPDDAGRTVDDLLHTAHHTSRTHWQQEYRFQRADGSWAIVFDRGYLLRNEAGQATRMIGAMQDITERKESEQRQHQLAQELVKQNADLQQFAYLVSHNLRAPLANAEGFTDLLGRLPRDSAEFNQTLTHLNTSLRQVDDILKELNTVLSMRERPLVTEAEPVPLAAVCRQVVSMLSAELDSCGGHVQCQIAEDLTLPGRKAYFHSIFYNLLSNAIKYRSPERPLRVQIVARPADDGKTTLTVADNGVGFDAARAGDTVFQLYKRFHTNRPGRGIGLFLVKAHAESMGGTVAVESSVNTGTTFTLQFSPLSS